MNKSDTIKDMRLILLKSEMNCKAQRCDGCEYFENKVDCIYELTAGALYSAGYRKINDYDIVMSKEEWETLYDDYAKVLYNSRRNESKEVVNTILQIVDGKLDLYTNGVIGGTPYDAGYKSAINEIKIAIKNKFCIDLEG